MARKKEIYDRFAQHYDSTIGFAEKKWFSEWRAEYLPKLTRKILEIGIGSGQSIRHYAPSAQVIGIDSSTEMLKIANKRLAETRRSNIVLRKMSSDSLKFPSAKFDFVVTFLVFCSVPKPEKTISEIRRVLKRDGKGIFIEHVLSENKMTALSQKAMNPASKFLISDNIARNTRQDLKNAGFKIVKEKNLLLGDVFRVFFVKKYSKN